MRILIVKTSSLGDIIHVFPAIAYIKHVHPEALVDWVVEESCAELVRAHPLVHKTLTINTKVWRKQFLRPTIIANIMAFIRNLRAVHYDWIFDLQGNSKSGFVTKIAKGTHKVGFSRNSVSEWPNILATNCRYQPPAQQNIRADYLFLIQKAWNQTISYFDTHVQLKLTLQESRQLGQLSALFSQNNSFKILVCPASRWPNKQTASATLEQFLQAIVHQLGAHLLFTWGNSAEKVCVEQLASAFPTCSMVLDKLSLPLLQNVMGQMDLVIAMDSLPLHLAGTTNTPSYSIFGASSALKYRPSGVSHAAFQGECPYKQTFEKRCAQLRTCKTGACMKEIQATQLFDHFLQWWNTRTLA